MDEFVEVPILDSIDKRDGFVSEHNYCGLFFIYEFLDEHIDEMLISVEGACIYGHFSTVKEVIVPISANNIRVFCRICKTPMARICNIAKWDEPYRLEIYKEYV